jgi:hypothetical protein
MAQSLYLREQAERCRRLARSSGDVETEGRLRQLALEYDRQADVQEAEGHAGANGADN